MYSYQPVKISLPRRLKFGQEMQVYDLKITYYYYC